MKWIAVTIFCLVTLRIYPQINNANSLAVKQESRSAMNQNDDQLRDVNIFVAVKQDLIVIQWKNLNSEDRNIILSDSNGKEVAKTVLYMGSTIAYFDIQTLYSGDYVIAISDENKWISKQINIPK